MAELQERSHSSFWEFIRANQEAMEAFYRGDLDASERLAEHCLELADALPEEDGSRHLRPSDVPDPARTGSPRGDGSAGPQRRLARRTPTDVDARSGAAPRSRPAPARRPLKHSPGSVDRVRPPRRRDVEHGHGVADRDDGAARRRGGLCRAP